MWRDSWLHCVEIPVVLPSPDICERALEARDARFDGVFYVGITSTGIYCRPVCPSRFAASDHRRFFASAASAEHAGFRPCLRCRPELAPGRGQMEALPRLAAAAAERIAAGALNGRGVAELAADLGVSERHLRRAVERAISVSPIALAQTHRLLLAKQLLVDTSLSVTQIAFASGFQSLRRFNSVFRERYRLSPTDIRRARNSDTPLSRPTDLVRLTLAYRPPMAWDTLIAVIGKSLLPGVETVANGRYGRTVRMGDRKGVVFVQDGHDGKAHVVVEVSTALLPSLMPLLARIRRLFDLDAEPNVVDAHLAQAGLGELVARRPGMRVPGAFDGFEVALALMLHTLPEEQARRVMGSVAEPCTTEVEGLWFLAPRPERVAQAPGAIGALARAVLDGSLRLEPGADAAAARRALMAIPGMDDWLATTIVMRALHWPDAFPASDRARAEPWRPWRAYAALHLWS
jgi:AraC family transcriptional regulator, regulatory protein of adaptative response / DNA-3-methyladenine glycosylase II